MEATIIVKMGNAAFEDGNGAELARILRELAKKVEDEQLTGGEAIALRDANGNSVGHFRVNS